MSIALTSASAEPREATSATITWLHAAALASLGAGAIHAAAIGVHAENRPAALAFTLCAALQLGWGGLALVRSGRAVAAVGVLINLGALGAWAVAKSAGIGLIDGLDVAEPVQLADGMAAGLAFASVAFAGISLTARSSSAASWLRAVVPVTAVAVLVVGVSGMASAASHSHGSGGHGQGETAAAGHEHGDEASADEHAGMTDDEHAAHESAAVPAVPYDPTKPIDLGGVPGVTPEQQAEAENVLAVTLVGLPQWSDYQTAEAAGFQTIGDGFTGIEHFINQEYMDDDVILDPDKPESLVYDTSGNGKRLVAAMYMLKRGTPMAEVPTMGGDLMQWHIHNNLCYQPNGRLGGLTDAEGNCAPGLIKPEETPMIHVWLESHPCGPFAALEGVGGGEVAEGEEVLCDEAHGAH